MKHNLLKIRLERTCKVDPAINVWNIFDSEHPPFIHSKRKLGEGMEPSYILYENDNMNVTLDTQRLPILSFIKYRSVMVHIAGQDNSVIQYSSFFGVPTIQKYSAIKGQDDSSSFVIVIVFYLSGMWIFAKPFIKFYVEYWLAKTWEEDLIMKVRRHKFNGLGFSNMSGLPKKISERYFNKEFIWKLPLPRVSEYADDHPFSKKNQEKLFEI